LRKASERVREDLARLLALLARGASLGMPVSRPMPIIAQGAHELRIKDASGHWRVFYYTRDRDALLVFHAFTKKSEQTRKREIETGKIRLKEMRP